MRGRITAYSPQGIGEQNTKAGLIAPVLRSLGWDIEDLREVHMEYKPRASDKPVDYALLLNGQPRMFVEAKALGQNLDDRRWANQIMGYAAVAGVQWVVLTNGDEYRIYNAHAGVPVEEKLFRRVFVTADDGVALETLALLSKESVAELEALWQEDFIDRQVGAALSGLFEPEPDPGLVRLLRKRLPAELSPRDVRSALVRSRAPRGGDATLEGHAPPPAPREAAPATSGEGEAPAHGEGTPWGEVKLGDIISAGLLRPPVELFRRYKSNDLRARIEPDGRVSFGGQVYGTLTTRLDQTSEDQKRGFNRTEVLSPIPASDPDFKKLAWLRNDAESNNSALEDKLFNKRAHSVGSKRQRANLLGYALLVNSLTLYLARRRGGARAGHPPPGTMVA